MTSRERVVRAVKFLGPDRVPYDLPEPWGSDFFSPSQGGARDWQPAGDGKTEQWTDEWGCVWSRLAGDTSMGQVTVNPLADYRRLSSYTFPDYASPSRYEAMRRHIAENAGEKFILAGVPVSFIHRLEYLRGHEAAWTDPYLEPDRLEELLDRMADCAIDAIRNVAAAGCHGVISADDWGLQTRLMVRPELFRRFWKPRYARVYAAAHDCGLLTFLHSCGYISEIIADLIEAGLDVIQMDQQENMGLEELGRRFGGKIAFWCPVDIQQTMVKGSVDDVRNYARALIDTFGRFNGGFIAKWYPDPVSVRHAPEKVRAMAETFVEYGSQVYRK